MATTITTDILIDNSGPPNVEKRKSITTFSKEETPFVQAEPVKIQHHSSFFRKLIVWSGIGSFFGILQLMLLAMKLNYEISWGWATVFLWSWVFLAILALVSLSNIVNILRERPSWISYMSSLLLGLSTASFVIQLIVLCSVLDTEDADDQKPSWHMVFLFSYIGIGVAIVQPVCYILCPRAAYAFAFFNGVEHEDDDEDDEDIDAVGNPLLCGNIRDIKTMEDMPDEAEKMLYYPNESQRYPNAKIYDSESAMKAKWRFHLFLVFAFISLVISLALLSSFLDHCYAYDNNQQAYFNCETLFYVFLPIITFLGISELAFLWDCIQKCALNKRKRKHHDEDDEDDDLQYCDLFGSSIQLFVCTMAIVQTILVWAAISYYWQVSWNVVFIPAYIVFSTLLCVNGYSCSIRTSESS